MLEKVFQRLDDDVVAMNQANLRDGLMQIPRFFVKVLGQTALLEANIGLPLLATSGVGAYTDFVWVVRQRFCELLKGEGRHYDELSHEIWMPEETRYRSIHKGRSFDGFIAEPEFVLLSKAKKAPVKNRHLLRDYLAAGPSDLFLALAQRYQVDLEEFLK